MRCWRRWERAACPLVLAGLLADVLSAQGQDVEADRFVNITRDTASATDVMPQVLWRRSLARTTARRGDTATAEELARSAVALAGKTDFLDLRASSLISLGEVLRDAGKDTESAASLDEAREVYARKGNLAALRVTDPAGEFVP